MSGFDIFDGDIGLFASASDGGAAVLLTGGDNFGMGSAESGTPPLALDGRTVAAELAPTEISLELDGEQTGAVTVELCGATGSLDDGEATTELDCPAARVTTSRPPAGDLVLARSIVIVLGDGGLLAISSGRATSGEVDSEEIVAAHARVEGNTVSFAESLLSTEHGPDGEHRRATLELWPEEDSDERVVRGAGTRITGGTVEVGAHVHDVALFHWSVGGIPGLGRYEIVRAT